jgi:exosortase B
MTYSDTLAGTWTLSSRRWFWPALVGTAVAIAYAPTFITLAQGPWQTEQEGHGPLIMAASVWLVWRSRRQILRAELHPAPVLGWTLLLAGLLVLILARNQDVWFLEVASEIPVIAGTTLLLGGWRVLSIVAFPICFLIFSAPAPGWMVDAATIPLKLFISDSVTQLLYSAGFPIAQNGVVILVGAYQLLVQDACSGLNSIFVLSALGVFYVYAFRLHERIRASVLLLLIIPITVFANFLRVTSLVLIAYYGGVEKIEGPLHDMTGIALFVVAVLVMFLSDSAISLFLKIFQLHRRRSGAA